MSATIKTLEEFRSDASWSLLFSCKATCRVKRSTVLFTLLAPAQIKRASCITSRDWVRPMEWLNSNALAWSLAMHASAIRYNYITDLQTFPLHPGYFLACIAATHINTYRRLQLTMPVPLSTDLRWRIVWLHHYKEYSNQDIADLLYIHVTTVRRIITHDTLLQLATSMVQTTCLDNKTKML